MHTNNLSELVDQYTLQFGFVMLFIDIVIYFVIGLWLNQVLILWNCF